jgi:hypothetical protein
MTKVGGYYSAIESDLSFNTKYGWSTSGTKNYDVQTTALHELGHTIGLGDLYGKSQFSGDTRQIMHYYTGVKTTLETATRQAHGYCTDKRKLSRASFSFII